MPLPLVSTVGEKRRGKGIEGSIRYLYWYEKRCNIVFIHLNIHSHWMLGTLNPLSTPAGLPVVESCGSCYYNTYTWLTYRSWTINEFIRVSGWLQYLLFGWMINWRWIKARKFATINWLTSPLCALILIDIHHQRSIIISPSHAMLPVRKIVIGAKLILKNRNFSIFRKFLGVRQNSDSPSQEINKFQ